MREIQDNIGGVVVSVGAGSPQLPFIKALKKKGYLVAAFGKGRNNLEAMKMCDYFNEIDTSDFNEAIYWLKGLDCRIVGAGSFAGGHAINTLHEITRTFSLPTAITEFLSVGMNKLEQQKLYEKYQLTSIKTFKPEEVRHNPDIIKGINKFIIKPYIGRGSSGVTQVGPLELVEMIKNDDFSEMDMIQELQEGQEYRMLIIIQEGKVKLLAPIKRESLGNTFLLGRLSYISEQITQIEEYVIRMIDNLRIKDSIIKADIIVNGMDINMIEMDIGVGGGIYFKNYISNLFNYDISEEYINLITGNEVQEYHKVKNKIVKDYIYNLSSEPIVYDVNLCKEKLSTILDSKSIDIIPNLLYPGRRGSFETNADFIFCVIHDNNQINNLELNNIVNNNLFQRIKG